MNVFDCFNIFSVIIVSFLCALVAIYLFASSNRTMRLQIPDILFAGYFLWAAIQKHPAFNISQLGDITMLLLYFSLRQVKKEINYGMVYRFVLIVCFILSSIGYLQYINILPVPFKECRISGLFYNPAPYGAVIGILLSIIIVVLIRGKGTKYLYTSFLIVFYSIPALLLSGSRAAWLLLIAAIAFAVVGQYNYKLSELSTIAKKILSGILLIITISICTLLYYVRPESVKGRLLIWKISTEMIRDSPITGLGYNGFESQYMKYQAGYFKQSGFNDVERSLAGNVVSVYCEPIRIMIEYGIIGLFLYISYIVSIFIFYKKKQDLVSQVTVTVILTYMLFGLFSYPNRIFLLQIILITATACLINNNSKIIPTSRSERLIYLSLRYFILSGVILFIPCISRLHFGYLKYQTLLKNPPEDIAVQFKQLEPILSGDALFLLNYCIAVNTITNNHILLTHLDQAIKLSPSSILYRMKGDCLCWMNEFEKAEYAYWTAHYMVPIQQRSKYKLVLLYLKIGNKAKARKLADEILYDEVKVNSMDTYVLHQRVKELLSIP